MKDFFQYFYENHFATAILALIVWIVLIAVVLQRREK